VTAAPTSISAIVPVHNGARFVSEALRSVKIQTLPADEIIVVDDGSSDGTSDIVRREHPDVVLIAQPRSGPAAARNAGRGARAARPWRSSTTTISGRRNATPPCSRPGGPIPKPTSSAARSACFWGLARAMIHGSGGRRSGVRPS
jgi:glycosyl transferase family 2